MVVWFKAQANICFGTSNPQKMLLTSKVVTSKTKKNHLATFTKVQSISMKHLAEGSFLLKEGFISFYKYLCDKKYLKTRITISC